MADYISREAFKKKYLCCGYLPEISEEEFDKFPSADVEPVRHGRWVVDYPDGTIYEGAALRLMFALITCSECGKTFELAKIGKARYCTCGSKMDLEEQNEP